jgi:transposase, IS5 family
MRKKTERQLPLDFAGTQKLTQDWYSLYRNIHAILEANPAITDLVHADLTQGEKKLKRNIEGVASESILRLALVQQIEGLSFRRVIVTVDDSTMLRFFCRFYDDPVISHSKYATLVNLIAPPTWEKINAIIVKFARDKKGFKGEKLRIDTTVMEADIHYPTDSSLLCDCVRVLSRLIGHVRKIDPQLVGTGRARLKNARRLAQKIARGGKSLHKATRRKWYGQIIAATERMMTWAAEVQTKIDAGQGRVTRNLDHIELQTLAAEIKHYLPLTEKCVRQARERVLKETRVPNAEKIFSIFEPHTELLIRGKAGKDVEFGHMVEVQQIEGGLITNYTVHEQRPVEPSLLEKAITRHREVFGHAPKECATDKGFYSPQAVAKAAELGVEKVCVPKKGRRNDEEETREKSRWFKLAQAFRAGIEGTISVLKRVFGWWRCLREGWNHFQSWAGTGVLAHNLVLLARR